MTERMISKCGLVCTECPAFIATRDGDEEKVREIAAQWSKEYHADVKPEHVWCDGCLVEGRKCAHCSECEIRACATKRAVESCAACPDYGCEILSAFHEMVPQARQVLESLRG
jgi:hypothetical protein